MPRYNNSFRSPSFIEGTIVNGKGSVIGTIRVKPSSILWKAKGKKKFLRVKLDKFGDWIADPSTRARSVKS